MGEAAQPAASAAAAAVAGAAAAAAAPAAEQQRPARWGLLQAVAPGTRTAAGINFKVEDIPLTRSPFVIGRNPECDCVLRNPAVSGRHCELRLCGETAGGDSTGLAVVVTDLSTNGIWVRGRRLGRGVREHILDGDEVNLVHRAPPLPPSDFDMRYRYRDAEEPFPVLLTPPQAPAVAAAAGAQSPASSSPVRTVSQLYDLGELIGKGGYASVVRARHRITGAEVAIKVVARKKVAMLGAQPPPQDPAAAAAREERQLREVHILRRVRHPGLVQVLDVFSDSDTIHLVLELARGGDLFRLLKDKGALSAGDTQAVMRQLCSAVCYLHEECQVAHRDIKPENVLLAEPGRVESVRLTDFGLARVFAACASGDSPAEVMRTVCGTPLYVAPEVVTQSPGAGGGYTEKCDMWGLGVLMWVMLTCKMPFAKVHDAFGRPTKRVNYTPPDWYVRPLRDLPLARELLQLLLSPNPATRPSAAAACAHLWLAEGTAPDAARPAAPGAVIDVDASGSVMDLTGSSEQSAPTAGEPLPKRPRS